MTIQGSNVRHYRRPVVSPLRYPGGKVSLYQQFVGIVRATGVTSGTYVEPYAGGAGAALALLVTGHVRRIVINDLDPAVYAFWKAAVENSNQFAGLIEHAKLTVDEWGRQKDIYRNADRGDFLRLGFATFYLNRTNRSGVLNAGPIGGMNQNGNYKIDARFNKTTLLERLRLISLYTGQISVSNLDGREIIARHVGDERTLIYADPPYFNKAGSLYMNSFTMEDHVALADCLNKCASGKWVLTYDQVPEVERFYQDRRRELFSLNYSAQRVMKANEIMVFSDGIPDLEKSEFPLGWK